MRKYPLTACKGLIKLDSIPVHACIVNDILYHFIYSKGITDSQQLHKAQQTNKILSVTLSSHLSLHIIMFIGSVDSKKVYFCLNNPITLSTCILTHESVREESTLSLLSCFLPLVRRVI